MTYGEVRDRVLQLLNQYSIAGTSVPNSYNNQADYVARIPLLVNDAMMEIATTNKMIPAQFQLNKDDATAMGDGWLAYEMPSDFFQLKGSGAPRFVDKRFQLYHKYRWMGEKTLLIRDDVEGDVFIDYYRYPRLLSASPSDSDVLDNKPETHMAIPFYVAAYLVIHDDAFLYATFYNKYEDKLGKMYDRLQTDADEVEDVYEGAFSGGDY